MADKVINNIKLPNGEIYSVGGAGRFGIKGDYSTHYGIEYCQHGLIENTVGTTDIVVKGGMMLCLPGAETKTTIGSDITYSVSSPTDVTVFYAEGNILEAGEVHYSVNEPADNGVENYIAWWNPDVGKWQFKSNDTGNVWREAIATPIADIRIEEGNIVRIDYIGYRLLNDDIYGLKSETANVDLSNLTQEGIDFIIRNSAGASLFDTKLVDHILTYEQTKGWALQGTYVYKEAIAGSRYGYPDFYNKCVEEKDLGVATETVLGENTITLYTNANGHTFYDIADKEAIDAWYNTNGIAWYYGIDKENERIFLPRTKYCAFTGGVMGNGMALGLTDGITDTGLRWSTTVALSADNNSYGTNIGGSTGGHTFGKDESLGITTDSTKSGIIAEPDETKYLYICVGNTNVESAVTDVVDVTTTENDTVPLGYSTYQNGIVPNTSWLKSQGQWNDGNVYTTFYNEFVQKIGQQFASGYVKESTEEYDDYDLVINQDDITFRLPLLDGSEDLPSDRYEDLELLASGSPYTAPANGWFYVDKTATAANQYINFAHSSKGYGDSFSSYGSSNLYAKTEVTKGEVITIIYNAGGKTNYFRFIYAQGNGSLYFKVANAVQNLELLDAGEVLEVLSTKTDKLQACEASFPSDKYIDLTLGASGTTYTAPANGWFLLDKGQAGSQYVMMGTDTFALNSAPSSTYSCMCLYPAKKGTNVAVHYSASGQLYKFRFIYAQGEV